MGGGHGGSAAAGRWGLVSGGVGRLLAARAELAASAELAVP